jgi:sugar lactone lactonase YvrE
MRMRGFSIPRKNMPFPENPMLSRYRVASVAVVLGLISLLNAAAQGPVALPYTITTIGGQAPMGASTGTQCPGLPTGVTSTDAFGDGCLAVNGIFGLSPYSGLVVDSFGNVIVNDDIKGVMHLINPTSGLMTLVAGGNTACSGKIDSSGDGCVAATGTATTLVTGARGVGIDPYGNVLLAGYNDHFVHIVCRNASPLCVSGTPAPSAAAPIQVQLGYLGLVAGCTYSGGSNGVSAAGNDNTPAFSTPTAGFSGSPFVNAGGASTACTASLGEVDQPRGVTGDAFGNIYYADTSAHRWRVVLGPQSYNSVTNPLWAALEQNSAWYNGTTLLLKAGYVYTVGGVTATATSKGSSTHCTGNTTFPSPLATDTFGDGCLFTSSSVNSSTSAAQGVAVDAAGNLFFTDAGNGLLRVLFVSGSGTAGATLVNAIEVNNSGLSPSTPQPGFVYALAGSGSTGISTTPTLGSNTAALDSATTKLALSPQGNLFIGDKTRVLFFDINTGYIRTLFAQSGANVAAGSFCSGTSGPVSLSAYGDGCAASQAEFGNSNGQSVATDAQGNLYLYDGTSSTTGQLVRKVLAQGFAPQTLNVAQQQIFEAHLLGATAAASTAALSASHDFSAGSPACTLRLDESVDCLVTVSTTPTAAGLRSAALTVTNTSSGSAVNIALNGPVTGSVLVVDNASTTASSTTTPIAPTTHALLSSITPAAIATDGAGNVYVASSGTITESIAGTATPLSPALPSTPSQIAVDGAGNIYAVSTATSTIEELALTTAGTPSSYTLKSIAYPGCASCTSAPQAIAVDQAGNLYVADYQSSGASVYRLSLAAGAVVQQMTVASALADPVSLAVDASGNVFVADKSAGEVFKFAPSAGSYTKTTALTGVVPVALAVDAAGDVYVQDSTSGAVLEVPVSGPASVPVLTGLGTPAGVAVDGLGNVYSADATAGTVTEVVRDATSYNFGTSLSTTFAGTLTDAGNQASTGQNTSTSDTLNFAVAGGASSACPVSSSVVGAIAAGQACTLTAELTGTGSTTVNDSISFLPSASTAGALTLTGTLMGTSYPTTTQLGAATGSLTYACSGTEATFTITVAASTASTAPTGSVNVYVDSTSAYTQYALTASTSTSSTVTVNLSGLHAGNHTIAAVYPTTGQFTGSGSATSTTGFNIAQASTSTSWTPAATTQMVSQAIGSSVLNATATTSDTSVSSVAGTFSYTYTPAGGSATALDASTYLSIGTYSLGVTFTPVDSVDYATSAASIASYGVAQATTTAAVGASTNVVAADGTGNFTSLSAALASLPTTGGVLYLKPGTYTGQNAISYPNVQLRGLGGDPTKVILTAEDGAFSAPFVYPGSGAGNANASGDQGSSTLDVTKSAYMGTTLGSTTYVPNNFYAEYLTIQNTYNTDTTATTVYNTSGGSCAAGSTAHTLQYWYNAGQQCNSQALALWLESDQAVLNNVNLTSQQDTLYAGSQGCGTYCTVARQYFWQGLITGDVDYVFGDAAMVFDHTNFFTTWHGTSATGTETIEAQNKRYQTGSSNDYLSGYICNGCTLMSQSTGMTNLYYGRPYGSYSTWIMLNSNVDQVNPLGWLEFSGDTNLPTSTYAEFNTQQYTDPAVGVAPYPASLFGGSVIPTGGNAGAGVTGARETSSQDPGTLEASNSVKTSLTAVEAAQYYPVQFLGTTVTSATLSAGQSATWNPVTALANAVNSFAPTGNVTLGSNTQSVTILGRPQTPGAGIIPTGSYTYYDSVSGATCTAASSSCVVLASGTLDASGEAYLTTNSLTAGQTHTITMVYGGDSNFAGSTSPTFTITVPRAPLVAATTTLSVTNTSSSYGGTITGSVTVTPVSGAVNPTGIVTLLSGATSLGSCSLSNAAGASSSCSFSLTGVAAGAQAMTASYASDGTFANSTSSAIAFNVAPALLQVAANNATMIAGSALPSLTYSIAGFVNSDTAATATTGAPALSTTATGAAVGEYPIAINIGTLAAKNYTFTFTSGYLNVTATAAAAAVATGDTRTVTEPVFPAVCTTLNAAFTSVNDDLPASVDATVSNPDGARIQAALANCAGTGQAVELSVDGAGHNAYLTGPLSMPSGVTLLVDPGVYVYFSRNVQDYDKVAGTHTCGTVNSASATASCLPLINIPGTSSNVGIMGYGKLDGRGGDPLINAFPSAYTGQSWWGLSTIANSGGSQQNPRFLQISTGASNITLYKITLRNSPLFHVSTTGAVSNFTAWDVKIVTPTSARNTDGIDPGNAQNFTITRSWISDGDDNIAVGSPGTTKPSANISVTHNHFFAGHGESIGSYTQAGASNILFDGNMSSGNATAGSGSSVNNTADSNSTGLRLKSGYDRGGLVTNVQFSNSCYQYHKAEIVFSPNYEASTGTASPDFTNILLQNLAFLTAGTAQLTGTSNGTVYPLGLTLDNVSFPSSYPSSEFSPAPTNAALTYGPGQVSANFISDFATFTSANGNSATNNITATTLAPPTCSFTYIAPELTGPNGLPQTIVQGQNATAIVILTPAVGGAAYPTGTVTLTDALTSNSITVTLTGSTDTIAIPLANLAPGTHTFTATYSGDANYPLPSGQTVYTTTAPYVVTVNSGSLASTSTVLSGIPSSSPYGQPVTAVATVTGASPTGTIEFVVNGVVYATAALTSGGASASLNLPFSASAYTIQAIYSGDASNAGSSSLTSSLTITPGATVTALSASTTSATLGHPVVLTASVSAAVGIPTGTVTFSYTTTGSATPVPTTALLSNGQAIAGVDLPVGVDTVTATYAASGSYSASASAPMPITVTAGTPLTLPSNPIPLAYTMTTLAGGAASNCSAATDTYGDGCPATSIVFGGSPDLRSVTADPFGNIYLTDAVSSLVRRIAPNGVISNFAGRVTGTACVPTATTGCTPTVVSLNKPRGVASDALGNIYIAGYSSNEVFKVSVTDGLMYVVAGTGTSGSVGDGGSAAVAQVNGPRGVWADAVGNVYIADTSNNKIRVVDIAGSIHTFAGTGAAASNGDGGLAAAAAISNPQGVLTDANLNVYIADTAKVRVVCVTCGTGSPLDALLASLGISSPQNGFIYTIAGGAAASYSGAYPTLATNVTMSPQKLAIDLSSNLYISDGAGVIWMLDSHSANIRPIAGKATANCASETDNFGDGCPATKAVIGNNGNGIGVGIDTLGNLYISDTLNARIRKVTTGLQSTSVATGSTLVQPVQLHFIPADSLATNGLGYSSSEWSLGAPACTTNTDATTDCLFNATFAPAVPGTRSTPLAVSSVLGNSASLALRGTGLGAGSTLDPASQANFGIGLQVTGLATDTAGNVYVADATSKQILRFAATSLSLGSSAPFTTLATLTAPGPVTVDARGFVFAGDTSTGRITQISPSGAVSTLALALTTPAGLATDALNNLYISDSATKAVYQLNPITGAVRTLRIGTLVAPAGLAIDPAGNLLVTDPGAPAIYRFNLQSGATTVVASSASAPAAIAADAAGNLLVADTASILALPASSTSAAFTVAALSPSSLAIDSAGNLYTGSAGAVLKLTRTQAYVQFAAGSVTPQAVTLLSSGNKPLQLTSIGQTDAADYSVTATASTDCTLSGNLPSSVVVGGVCAFSTSYTPTTIFPSTDTATLNGNLSNAALSTPALVQLTLASPVPVAVPNVVGHTQAAATTAITGAGLTVGTVSSANSSTVPIGNVISSTPVAATLVNPGSAVNLVVSSGPQQVAVPNVVGDTQGAATTAITSAGLTVGVITNQSSATVPAGTVISQTPAGGSSASAGTAVSLVLSSGTAPPVSLYTSSTITGSAAAGYMVTITVTNTGTGTITALTLTTATLGTASGSPLPQSAGSLAPGASTSFTVNFAGSAGADGASVPLKYGGTCTTGSYIGSMRSQKLP